MNKYIILSKNKNFLYSYISMVISSFGDSLTLLALPLFAFNQTGSAMSSGIIMFAETIPWIVIAPIIGKYIDDGEKKKFLLIGDLIRIFTTLVLLFANSMMMVYILVFINGTFTSIFSNARSAMTSQMLKKEELDAGLTLSNSSKQTINIIGPLVGTLLLMGLNVKVLFFIDSITYLISFILNSKIKIERIDIKIDANNTEDKKSSLESIKESIRYIFENYTIRYILFIDCITTIFEAIVSILLVVFIKETLAFNDSIYSTIITVHTIGLILGSFLLSALQKKYNSFKIIKIVGFLISGIFLINIFSNTVLLLSLVWLIYGILLGVREVLIQILLMKHVDDSKKGKIFSTINSMLSICYIAGYLSSGYMVDNIGIINTFIFCTIFCAIMLLSFEFYNIKMYKKISLED